ncbi:DUF4367 domain-containing protein [Paenibacillus polymyxa]|uniref:DUF4367 domain-containing protein n=1 Tax=Paenibacillus polymyxa TaxID=1406 RepID=UPI0008BAEF82|nr:DUF4367 domain-containing protein [Paenibacillus polymyxa]AUS29347.1 hypothetical protein C1A50_5237 [Paenibacillus polymyxa]UQQ35319.1 DUF4367 domain-containing protein [Paenibacillus polymyxa]SEJ38576.1 hypothetical protein SAMN04488600_102528 [Paenibacillus polymyxa]
MRELQDRIQKQSLKYTDLQDRGFKNMDKLTEPENALKIQAFDVSDKVMEQVYQKAMPKKGNIGKIHFQPRSTVPIMILLFVVGASVTGYAASQYLEFRNSTGNVVLNTAKTPTETDASKAYTSTYAQWDKEVKGRLQPGEYAAYYVKDDSMNQKKLSNPALFAYKPAELSSFNSLQDEIKRTEAPLFNNPTHLPDGYKFEFGYVYPVAAYPGMMDKKEYRALTDQLMQQAKAAPEGENLFIQKLSWDKSDSSFARYARGNDYVNITVTKYTPEVTKTTIMQNEQDSAEQVTIKGTKVYYIRASEASKPLEAGKNRLGWLDEKRHLHYNISDNQDSPLTKEDLVKIAEDLLNGSPQ